MRLVLGTRTGKRATEVKWEPYLGLSEGPIVERVEPQLRLQYARRLRKEGKALSLAFIPGYTLFTESVRYAVLDSP